MMGHREIEKSELLWFHLSEVKHLNQQHFYVFEAWGLHFLMIPLQKKKCSRTLLRNKWITKGTDTKPEILVLRVYMYDLAEGAGEEGLTENTMQISPD